MALGRPLVIYIAVGLGTVVRTGTPRISILRTRHVLLTLVLYDTAEPRLVVAYDYLKKESVLLHRL